MSQRPKNQPYDIPAALLLSIGSIPGRVKGTEDLPKIMSREEWDDLFCELVRISEGGGGDRVFNVGGG